jgi:hypothetical protein
MSNNFHVMAAGKFSSNKDIGLGSVDVLIVVAKETIFRGYEA